MYNFVVKSCDTLKDVPKKAYALISILSPDSTFEVNQNNAVDMIRLIFHDFDAYEYAEYIDLVTKKYNAVLFSKEQAKQIIDFFNKNKDIVDTFVIHCEEGISRSPAVAAALSKLCGQNEQIYFNKYLPNMHVYRTILEEAERMSNESNK